MKLEEPPERIENKHKEKGSYHLTGVDFFF